MERALLFYIKLSKNDTLSNSKNGISHRTKEKSFLMGKVKGFENIDDVERAPTLDLNCPRFKSYWLCDLRQVL